MASLDLAAWIVDRQPGLTHLKLQKLAFYCYGYALADARSPAVEDLGSLQFNAWKHGPVEISVYKAYSANRALPIYAPVGTVPSYQPTTDRLLSDVLVVYGTLSAWELREETHLEAPWQESFQRLEGSEIPTARIREHFLAKTAPGFVRAPIHLIHGASAAVDGIPPARYASLGDLAKAVRAYA